MVFGEENPTESETPVPWATWAGTGAITGDPDWGKLQLDIGENGYSRVYDFGNNSSRTYTLTENVYGSGSGTATLQIRGQEAPFAADSGSPAWDNYSSPQLETWRYVQVREIKT